MRHPWSRVCSCRARHVCFLRRRTHRTGILLRYTGDVAKEQIPQQWDHETEVAVIGAGAGGPVAAISALDAGASVLVLEKKSKNDQIGNISISAGCVYASGTSIQKEAGIGDSPDRMFRNWRYECFYAHIALEYLRMLPDRRPEV